MAHDGHVHMLLGVRATGSGEDVICDTYVERGSWTLVGLGEVLRKRVSNVGRMTLSKIFSRALYDLSTAANGSFKAA